jgi:hypothetical protein
MKEERDVDWRGGGGAHGREIEGEEERKGCETDGGKKNSS